MSSLLAVDAFALSPGVRLVLLGVVALLLVALGGLVTYLFVGRRRVFLPVGAPAGLPAVPEGSAEFTVVSRTPTARFSISREDTPALAGVLAVVTPARSGVGRGSRVCPSCRREFDGNIRFCPFDARRLMPDMSLMERVRTQGGGCPRCRRGYAPGVRTCPTCSTPVVPHAVWEVMGGKRRSSAPTGVLGKLCPRCRNRYDLSSTFCTSDGSELVTVN